MADVNGHRTVYSAFQYVLLLTASINIQRAAIKANGNRRCMGTRSHVKDHTEIKEVRGQKRSWIFPEMGPYKWLTFNEVSQKVNAIGSALIHLGMKPVWLFNDWGLTRTA